MGHLLLLEFNRGDVTEKEPRFDHLTSDSTIIILDDSDHKIYIWQGKNIGLVERRTVARTAQTLKRFGYSNNNVHYDGFTDVIILDESDINKPDIRSHYDTIKEHLLRIEAGQDLEDTPNVEPTSPPMDNQQPEVIPADVVVTEPSEEVEMVTEKDPKESPSSDEPVILESSGPTFSIIKQGNDEITPDEIPPSASLKTGALIFAIMQEYPEIYVSKQGSSIIVESPEGTLTVFRLLERELELSPEYDFKGKQEAIISHYSAFLADMKQ